MYLRKNACKITPGGPYSIRPHARLSTIATQAPEMLPRSCPYSNVEFIQSGGECASRPTVTYSEVPASMIVQTQAGLAVTDSGVVLIPQAERETAVVGPAAEPQPLADT